MIWGYRGYECRKKTARNMKERAAVAGDRPIVRVLNGYQPARILSAITQQVTFGKRLLAILVAVDMAWAASLKKRGEASSHWPSL